MAYSKQEALLKKITTYQSSMPDVAYTYVPTSEINVTRAVNSQPYWAERVTNELPKPKKWIITDCSFKYPSLRELNKHPEDLSLFYEFILNQGVECYVWTGELTKVDDLQSLLAAMTKVESIDPDTLKEKLAKQNITKNQSEIVDYPYAKALRTALQSIIPGMHDQSNVIDLQDLSPEDKLLILKGLKNLTIEDRYRPSVLMRAVNLAQIQGQKKITISPGFFQHSKLEDIASIPNEVELILQLDSEKEILEKVLRECAKKNRKIHGLIISDNSFSILKNKTFPDLKYLEIKDSYTITETDVNEFIKNSNLKSLKIINCMEIEEDFLDAKHVGKSSDHDSVIANSSGLSYMKTLSAIRSNVNKFEYLFVSCAEGNCPLEDALFYSDSQSESDSESDSDTLDSYSPVDNRKKLLAEKTELQLNESPIDKETLLGILSYLPELRKIKMEDLTILITPGEPKTLELIPTVVSLKESTLDLVSTFLSCDKNIKLNLDNMQENLRPLLANPNFPWDSIKEIESSKLKISGNGWNHSIFSQIFKYAPHLSELHFQLRKEEMNAFLDFARNSPEALSNIKTIQFYERSELDRRSLKTIFSLWPNIKINFIRQEIDYRNEKTIFDDFFIPPELIPKLDLKELYFGKVISDFLLNGFLKRIPEITYLRLNYLNDALGKYPTYTLNKLTTLELVNFSSDSYLDLALIKSIKNHAPNLTHLILNDLYLTADTLLELLELSPQLTKITGHHAFLIGISEEEFEKLKSLFPDRSIELQFSILKKEVTEKTGHYRGNPSKLDRVLNRAEPSWEHPKQLSSLDPDTGADNLELHARQLFEPKDSGIPRPNQYRLKVHNSLSVGEEIKYSDNIEITARKIYQAESNLKEIYDLKYQKNPNVFYGQISLPSGLNDWYPLPSLSPTEEILNLSTNKKLLLGYCKNQNLFYVKPALPLKEPLNIDFLLQADFHTFNSKNKTKIRFQDLTFDMQGELIDDNHSKAILSQLHQLTQEEKIAALQDFCKSFELKKLDSKPAGGINTLNAIIKNASGVCRHRTFVFMALAKKLGIKARAIENDIHAYVEVDLGNGQWTNCDLGGAPGNVNIHKLDKDKTTAKERADAKTKTPTLSPNNPYISWDSIQSQAQNFPDYVKEILEQSKVLAEGKRNVLVALEADQIEHFHKHMTHYMVENNNQFYYLPSLAEVNDYQAIIEEGQLKKIDSNLVQFVKNAKVGDALVSNWTEYKASYVGYNTMMDVERKLKSHTIPPKSSVIVLIDKNKLSELREDFTSRFRANSICPDFDLEDNFERLNRKEEEDCQDFVPAQFYNSDWENTLLGSITIQGREFKQEEGLLVQALVNRNPGLLLTNAPWDNEKFRLFMTELLEKRSFSVNGKSYTLPEGFTIKREQKPYVLESPLLSMADPKLDFKDSLLLNSQTLNHFLKGIRCEEELIYHKPGWIKQHASKSINVVVSETLPENVWANLVDAITKHQCSLKIMLAPDVTLPLDMKLDQTLYNPVQANTRTHQIIETNDLELAEETLLDQHPDALVVSINDKIQFQDLIEKTVRLKRETEDFAFKPIQGTVWKKLLKGNDVILKGQLSPILAKQLESLFLDPPFLWVNGEKQSPKGKLLLLTDQKNPLSFVKEEQMKYEPNDFWQILDERYKDSPNYPRWKKSLEALQQKDPKIVFSYGQLRHMAEKIHQGILSNPFKPFYRMNPNDPVLVLAKEAWVKEPKNTKNKDVMTKRQDKIISELKGSNYLFVVGPSGVGKSTHILKKLAEENRKVYVGIENLRAWLKSTADDEEILFIDEVNLAKEGTWDLLEGLFNKTPGILDEGKFRALTPNKKIIFAANFSHFAGRQHHRFFERHGQVINFKELPNEVLTAQIIRPALNALFPNIEELTFESINEQLLTVYTHINTKLPNHPFTPRNLKSIALRMAVLLERFDYQLALKMAIIDEANSVLTKEESKDLEKLIGLEHRDKLLDDFYKEIPERVGSIVVTPSRFYPLYLLKQQFAMRELIISKPELSELFTIPNLLIEGLPGIGKSRLVIEYLKSLGYTEGSLDDGQTGRRNHCFYHLTPTDPDLMEATLEKAFHEGAYVIIDELNTLPLEGILNRLYDGIDKKGEKALNTGFSYGATQNPAISFANREALSTAMLNRLNLIKLDDFPESELRAIATKVARNESEAHEHVDLFLESKAYGTFYNKNPLPAPRSLFETIASLHNLANKEKVEFVRENTSDSELQKDLNEYVTKRQSEAEQQGSQYHSFFGRLTGMSAKLKINAAKKILQAINEPHKKIDFSHEELDALRSGRLGEIIENHQNDLPEQYRKSNDEYSFHLFRQM